MERIWPRQGGGRLVEDDDARVARKRPHDAENGFARGAQRTHGRARVRWVERHGAIDLLGLPPNLVPGDEATGLGKSSYQRHILADAQFIDQAKVLMDKRDRHGFRMGMDPTSAHEDLARVGLIEPGEDLDQRRLAGPVLADKRVDLARHDCQADAIQGKRAEKPLRETPDLNRGKRLSRHGGSFDVVLLAAQKLLTRG